MTDIIIGIDIAIICVVGNSMNEIFSAVNSDCSSQLASSLDGNCKELDLTLRVTMMCNCIWGKYWTCRPIVMADARRLLRRQMRVRSGKAGSIDNLPQRGTQDRRREGVDRHC